ncbi:MAG TPA: metallophosphoesterase family protein [Dictyobacter sp.]|jgi:diadenosine tetraphosphatase ApaH/serine/threonine PP2A family protein phosphatase|nr:metallophosphoesterase family protein [Dictyobacter sp.]
MRYAIFTDVHANLEALETVLAKIDEIAQENPIDEIWFLGDLVGYGPNPNECIAKIRERTNVIIAGNHDWAAVGKIDLEDFSEAARISAEWTAQQLTAENREFLANLPERLDKGECVLVHGSPFGPLWEYLTSEVLAERSFQHFSNRFCLVGHTHVPVIFQQADTLANSPTQPLEESDITTVVEETHFEDESPTSDQDVHEEEQDIEEADTTLLPEFQLQTARIEDSTDSVHAEPDQLQDIVAEKADTIAGLQQQLADDKPEETVPTPVELTEALSPNESEHPEPEQLYIAPRAEDFAEPALSQEDNDITIDETTTPEEAIHDAEERLNQEIEELLTLLGLSQSMIEVTNEMILPPEGQWQAPEGYRAIINPGGVGQPRDGDPRTSFMIYDTEKGFTFYRIDYPFEKTQEKIIEAKLPHYLATRLAYGR